MDNESEIVWAKLNGNWNDANYRRSLVDKNMCLSILAVDTNRAVANAATSKMVGNILEHLRNTK